MNTLVFTLYVLYYGETENINKMYSFSINQIETQTLYEHFEIHRYY